MMSIGTPVVCAHRTGVAHQPWLGGSWVGLIVAGEYYLPGYTLVRYPFGELHQQIEALRPATESEREAQDRAGMGRPRWVENVPRPVNGRWESVA